MSCPVIPRSINPSSLCSIKLKPWLRHYDVMSKFKKKIDIRFHPPSTEREIKGLLNSLKLSPFNLSHIKSCTHSEISPPSFSHHTTHTLTRSTVFLRLLSSLTSPHLSPSPPPGLSIGRLPARTDCGSRSGYLLVWQILVTFSDTHYHMPRFHYVSKITWFPSWKRGDKPLRVDDFFNRL